MVTSHMKIGQKLSHFFFTARRFKSHDEHHTQNSNRGSHRCAFTFSDGRRCRSECASFCLHHASKREAGFGAEGAPVDAVEALAALCSDLTSATNINRALTQVFLLMAQGRISQKQAVAFGYLTQLLLQTVPGVRAEFVSAHGYARWEENLKASLESAIRPGSSSRANNETRGVPDAGGFCAHRGASEGSLSDPANSSTENHIPEQQGSPAPLKKHHLTPEAIYDGLSPDDFESLYARSLDLFDRKYDFTPEGRTEKQILNYELELIKPPDTKPPKGHVGEMVKLARRFKQELDLDRPRAAKVARNFHGNPISPPHSSQSDHPATMVPNEQLTGSPAHAASVRSAIPQASLRAEVGERGSSPKPCDTASGPRSSCPQPASAQASIASSSAAPPGQSDGDGYCSSDAYHEYCENRDSLQRDGHTAEWYAPASWSGQPQPDPYPGRGEKLRGRFRSLGNSAFRRIQHQNSRGFWSRDMKHLAT